MNFTRRDFLYRLATIFTALGFDPGALEAASPVRKTSAEEIPSVLVDLTRCIGCRACVHACVEANGLPETEMSSDINLNHAQIPSSHLWTAVNAESTKDVDGNKIARTVKRQCMHCLDPACASACPVAALYKTEEGPVIYRANRCIGCRYCMLACPFDIPKFQWDAGLTPVIGKCQFCMQNRLSKGLPPACAAACPTGTLKFGSRKDLLFEAHARLHARPERYINHVYGEREVGGTAWLYLSDVPFENIGFKKNLPEKPLPMLTWMVISKIPGMVATLGVVLTGLSFLLRREERT